MSKRKEKKRESGEEEEEEEYLEFSARNSKLLNEGLEILLAANAFALDLGDSITQGFFRGEHLLCVLDDVDVVPLIELRQICHSKHL